jgi:hypothetical protein
MTEPLHLVPGEQVEVRTPRFRLIKFDQLRLIGETAYLVKRLIPRVGLIVVWGPPKSGKSFWTFDLTMHVALDWPYRGRKVHGGPVVYCALEGAAGIQKRVEAFRMERLAEDAADIPFYLLPTALDLVKDHKELIAAIRAQLGDKSPVAVVLDTLNRSLVGSESSDSDMAAYIRAADAIREAFNCAVVIVHHCGHDASHPRGHTSLPGAVDAQLSVKRDGADNIMVTVELMKDGPQGDEIFSRLKTVDIGVDEDDEPITSCVVVPIEGGRQEQASFKSSKRVSGAFQTALRCLREVIEECGIRPPSSEHIPQEMKVVTIQQWRECCYRRGISSSVEARARQQAFQRAFNKLVGSGDAAVCEEYVWIPE